MCDPHVDSFTLDGARIAGIFNVGSGSAGVARAVESLGLTGSVGVVVHDFSDQHRALLGANGLAHGRKSALNGGRMGVPVAQARPAGCAGVAEKKAANSSEPGDYPAAHWCH